jgi:hypothetical protein
VLPVTRGIFLLSAGTQRRFLGRWVGSMVVGSAAVFVVALLGKQVSAVFYLWALRCYYPRYFPFSLVSEGDEELGSTMLMSAGSGRAEV